MGKSAWDEIGYGDPERWNDHEQFDFSELTKSKTAFGRAGHDALHPDEGRVCLIRGTPYPSSLPTPFPVGHLENLSSQEH